MPTGYSKQNKSHNMCEKYSVSNFSNLLKVLLVCVSTIETWLLRPRVKFTGMGATIKTWLIRLRMRFTGIGSTIETWLVRLRMRVTGIGSTIETWLVRLQVRFTGMGATTIETWLVRIRVRFTGIGSTIETSFWVLPPVMEKRNCDISKGCSMSAFMRHLTSPAVVVHWMA